MSDEIEIERLNFGKLALDEPGKWSVPDAESLGVTSRSKGIDPRQAGDFSPANLLGIARFDRDLIEDAVQKTGCLFVREIQSNGRWKTALMRTRFRPGDGENGSGRLYQQTSVWIVEAEKWRDYASSILARATSKENGLIANPDLLMQASSSRFDVPVVACKMESVGDEAARKALDSPIVLQILDMLLQQPLGHSDQATSITFGPENLSDGAEASSANEQERGAVLEARFMADVGSALRLLWGTQFADWQRIRIAFGLKSDPGDKAFRSIRFLLSDGANQIAKAREVSRKDIEIRLRNITSQARYGSRRAPSDRTAPKESPLLARQSLGAIRQDVGPMPLPGVPRVKAAGSAPLAEAPGLETSALARTPLDSNTSGSAISGAAARSPLKSLQSALQEYRDAYREWRGGKRDDAGMEAPAIGFLNVAFDAASLAEGRHDSSDSGWEEIGPIVRDLQWIREGRSDVVRLGSLFDILQILIFPGDDSKYYRHFHKLAGEIIGRLKRLFVLFPAELKCISSSPLFEVLFFEAQLKELQTNSERFQIWAEKIHELPAEFLRPTNEDFLRIIRKMSIRVRLVYGLRDQLDETDPTSTGIHQEYLVALEAVMPVGAYHLQMRSLFGPIFDQLTLALRDGIRYQ